MNIYYVNRNSNLKGPFDIIDSNRQHIIKVGDICLRDTSDGIAFYVVYNSSNSWNSCKVVGSGDNDTLSDIGNTLLFSFDGLSRRKGNIALIKQVRMCFREKVIDDFFCNALDILEYKRDFWEGSLFPQFFASTQELVDRDEQKKSELSNDTNHYPSIFAKYLSEELLELLINSLNDGNELKEAYQILRTKHPELFRKALMKFLTENPSGTIFDKPADAYVPTEIVKEVEVPKATSRNDRPLVIIESTDNETFETNERIDKFLSEVAREELISIDEEVELAQKIRKGERNALNKLVRANMRVAIGIAKQYLHNGLEFEDLMQEGFLGLIKAAERFDETRGFAFVNYAPWWIRRSLSDAIVRNSSLIQFPMNARILHRKIWDFKVIYEHQNGFFPPVTEIEITGEDDLDRISFLNSLPNNLSNTCIPCEDLDIFEDNHNAIWEYENNEYIKYYVRSLLARLSKMERNIIIRVFGIGVREETLETIGGTYGLTRERVRQIKEKTIKKLRTFILSSIEEERNSQVGEKSTIKGIKTLSRNVAHSQNNNNERDNNVSIVSYETDELDDIKVGNQIVYHGKNCIIIKIIVRGESSKFLVKYDNGVLDYVRNIKSVYRKVSIQKSINNNGIAKENVAKDKDMLVNLPILSINEERNEIQLTKEKKSDSTPLYSNEKKKQFRGKKHTFLTYNGHEFRLKVGDYFSLDFLFSTPITIQGDPCFIFRKNILFVFIKYSTKDDELNSDSYLLTTDIKNFKNRYFRKYDRRRPRILLFGYDLPTDVQFLDEVKIRGFTPNGLRFDSLL